MAKKPTPTSARDEHERAVACTCTKPDVASLDCPTHGPWTGDEHRALEKLAEEAALSVDESMITWHGAPELHAFLVPIADVQASPTNVRRHTQRNLEAIRESLRRFGQRKPIVVRHGLVVAGEGTLREAVLLGWNAIAVVDCSDLTEHEARAYAIADNRTAELSEWDEPALQAELKMLAEVKVDDVSLSKLGFDESALDAPASDTKHETGEVASIVFTREAYDVVMRAVNYVRRTEQDPEMTPARAVELLMADFLAGVQEE